MAKRSKKSCPILLANLDDCLLGVMYARPGENGIPVAVYSGDMIAARLRDQEDMSTGEARAFVTDRIETDLEGCKLKGWPRIIWAATSEDFGKEVCPA
jgi:hypothetical protein